MPQCVLCSLKEMGSAVWHLSGAAQLAVARWAVEQVLSSLARMGSPLCFIIFNEFKLILFYSFPLKF